MCFEKVKCPFYEHTFKLNMVVIKYKNNCNQNYSNKNRELIDFLTNFIGITTIQSKYIVAFISNKTKQKNRGSYVHFNFRIAISEIMVTSCLTINNNNKNKIFIVIVVLCWHFY